MPSSCPLCNGESSLSLIGFQKLFKRSFYHCAQCDLRFADPESSLTIDDQKIFYDEHENDVLTEGYSNFLKRLIRGVETYSQQGSCGLDFGSGPYPMLWKLLQEQGYKATEFYDPIYASTIDLLNKKYDFVTCCEVIEHFNKPRFEFERLVSLLGSPSQLIISTGIYTVEQEFLDWYYIRDRTHVCFYSKKTFEYIANNWDLSLEMPEKDIAIFLKK